MDKLTSLIQKKNQTSEKTSNYLFGVTRGWRKIHKVYMYGGIRTSQ